MRKPRLLGATLILTILIAAAAHADVKVGVTAAVNPQAIGQPPTEPERMLLVGSDNFANEKITTGPEGQAQLLFIDGSSISVGPSANLTIDQYVYDTDTKIGKFAITAAQGAFKLVGGAISKTNEIVITTPVGTAGIRGGIANIETQPGQPLRAQFLFGTSLRVTSQGATQEVTRPGFEILVVPGQPPSSPVRMTTAEVRGSFSQFQGRSRSGGSGQPGQMGQAGGQGGQEPAQDAALTQSNLSSSSGSNQSPQSLSTVGGPNVFFDNTLNPNTQNLLQNTITEASNTNLTNQLGSGTLYGHFYCCNPFITGTFNTQTLTDTPNPSNNFTFSAQIANSTVNFTIPVTDSGQTQTFSFPFTAGVASTFSNLALINGDLISGTTMVSPDSTFLGIFGNVTPGPNDNCGGQSDCKFGLFAGLPTTSLPTSQISTYNITPIFDTIPFVHNSGSGNGLGLPGVGKPGVSSSPLFVAWSPVTNPTLAINNGQRATWLQSTLVISGSGANQQSGLIGAIGGFYQEQNSTIAMGGGVVGMARTSSTGVLTRVASGVASAQIQTATGLGNAIYGPNAETIVAVPDLLTASPSNPLTRQSAAQEQIPFDTLTSQQSTNDNLYVNVLTQNAPSSAPTQTANTTPRTDNTGLTGYTGGLLDSRSSGGTINGGGLATSFGGTVAIQTSATNNRMAAQFNFTDSIANNYNLQLGGTTGFNDGRSSFINNSIFGARDSVDTNGNPTSTVNGTTVAFNKLFMVSAATVPIDFQTFAGSGVTACTCSFMQWGWWIGEVLNPTTNARERFNLATWVAGTVPQAIEIPLTGSATFMGSAVGNVSSSSAGNYVAAGNYVQSWTFNTASGTGTITHFDSGGPVGTVSASFSLSGSGATFSGPLTTGTGVTSGSLNGSFFKNVSTNDPTAGVGGYFALSGSGYKASGTVMACKVGTGC